jgi:hypothetical protein
VVATSDSCATLEVSREGVLEIAQVISLRRVGSESDGPQVYAKGSQKLSQLSAGEWPSPVKFMPGHVFVRIERIRRRPPSAAGQLHFHDVKQLDLSVRHFFHASLTGFTRFCRTHLVLAQNLSRIPC